jgi:hypothetical protein
MVANESGLTPAGDSSPPYGNVSGARWAAVSSSTSAGGLRMQPVAAACNGTRRESTGARLESKPRCAQAMQQYRPPAAPLQDSHAIMLVVFNPGTFKCRDMQSRPAVRSKRAPPRPRGGLAKGDGRHTWAMARLGRGSRLTRSKALPCACARLPCSSSPLALSHSLCRSPPRVEPHAALLPRSRGRCVGAHAAGSEC